MMLVLTIETNNFYFAVQPVQAESSVGQFAKCEVTGYNASNNENLSAVRNTKRPTPAAGRARGG